MADTPTKNDPAAVPDFNLLAKEFASLLAASDIDDQTQLTLLESLPHLKLEEIVDLMGILEAKYVVGETHDLDGELTEKLEQITVKSLGAEQSIDAETIKRLEELADSIE